MGGRTPPKLLQRIFWASRRSCEFSRAVGGRISRVRNRVKVPQKIIIVIGFVHVSRYLKAENKTDIFSRPRAPRQTDIIQVFKQQHGNTALEEHTLYYLRKQRDDNIHSYIRDTYVVRTRPRGLFIMDG